MKASGNNGGKRIIEESDKGILDVVKTVYVYVEIRSF